MKIPPHFKYHRVTLIYAKKHLISQDTTFLLHAHEFMRFIDLEPIYIKELYYMCLSHKIPPPNYANL